MVHSLLFAEAGDGGEHSKSVTAEQNEILGMRPHTGDPGIVDVVDGVRSSCVFRHSTAQTDKLHWLVDTNFTYEDQFICWRFS